MEPAPRPWGLRGDPLLFAAMKQVFAQQPAPRTRHQLRAAYLSTFETLTGVSLAEAPEHIPVKWAQRENGGMSNGLVARGYWQDQMLPTLLDRLRAFQNPGI